MRSRPQAPAQCHHHRSRFAPRNARGMVEYVATFPSSNRSTWRQRAVCCSTRPNRGRITDRRWISRRRSKTGPRARRQRLAGRPRGSDVGDAVGAGCQDPDGSSITGRVLARFSDMPANTTTLPILRGGVAGTADPASPDTSKATLTRRASEGSAIVPLRSEDWAFADCSRSPFPGTPDPRKICLKGGSILLSYELPTPRTRCYIDSVSRNPRS